MTPSSSIRRRLISTRGYGVGAGVAAALALGSFGAGSATASGENVAAEIEVRFEIRCAGCTSHETPARLPARLKLTPVSGDEGEVLLDLTGGSTTTRLVQGSLWARALELEGYWTESAILNVDEAETVHVVEIHPAGRLEGTVEPPEGRALPNEISVRFSPPSDRRSEDGLRGVVRCPIGKAGRWGCTMPVGEHDLRLRARGFISHYRWDFAVRRGTHDVGTLQLREGASVTGWVAVEDGAPDPDRCKVSLAPIQGPIGRSRAGQQVRASALEAPVAESGFFELDGVPPGSYLLRIEQPPYAPAEVFPVEVWPGAETALEEPVVLRPPVTIELAIDPPRDGFENRWQLRLFKSSEFRNGLNPNPVYTGPADEEGKVTVADQSPGYFFLSVVDSAGNELYSDDRLWIGGPEDASRTVEIDLLTVVGEVRLGDEPLRATLWFGGKSGAVHSRMSSDPEGAFEGTLSRDGSWKVEVESEEEGIHTTVRTEVEADEEGEAEVRIDLPATELHGRVTRYGSPMAGAVVFLETAVDTLTAVTDRDGEYRFRAVPEGLNALHAQHRDGSSTVASETLTVTLHEGVTLGPVELELKEQRTLAGTVVSPRGPVVGASLELAQLVPRSLFRTRARTDLDGRFSVEVPEEAEVVQAIVSPPGAALTAFTIQKGESSPALFVDDLGGRLAVEMPAPAAELQGNDLQLLVFQDGLLLPTSTLLPWARSHGDPFDVSGPLAVGALAPGAYQACLAPRPAGLAALQQPAAVWASGLGSCDQGVLTPGAELLLAPTVPATAR